MANLRKVIYINEEDYSTLINGDSLVIDGTTYTYEENALYVIKNAGPPEYAETAGYATNAGTSQVAVTDASGNNIVATYEKKPLVIEIERGDVSVQPGTYNNIKTAIANKRNVIVKFEDANEFYYLPLIYDGDLVGDPYMFCSSDEYTFNGINIYDDDTYNYFSGLSAPDDSVVHILGSETITGNKTFTGTVSLGSNATATTPAATDNDTSVATTAFVKTVVANSINELPSPMIFKGSLGTGGTITALPAATTSNEGYTYKVITNGTYGGQSAKIGDTFISDGSNWIYIPSGDEPSGTVTNVKIQATSPIAIDDSTAITTSGTRTISHNDSGVTAGTYKSVTVDVKGHVTGGTNPTTLAGYGITDAVTLNTEQIITGQKTFGLYGDERHTYNVCNFYLKTTFKHVVLYTNLPYSSGSFMPVITLKGFQYSTTDLESKITFYIYNNEFYTPRVQHLGAASPIVYLFTYSDNGTERVAVGLEGNFYYLGFQADIHFPALGEAYKPKSQWTFNTDNITYDSTTTEENRIIPSIGVNHCVRCGINSLGTTTTGNIAKIGSSTDNAVVRFDGTTSAIQNSGVIIDDNNNLTANSFKKTGGTSSQFLKADGSVDSNTYLTQSTLNSGNPDLAAIEALSGTSGLLKKTAANTWTLDTNAYLTQAAFNSGNPDLAAIEALSGTSGILKKTANNTWILDTNTYLTSYTETDPTVPSHVKAITTGNISDWNNKLDEAYYVVNVTSDSQIIPPSTVSGSSNYYAQDIVTAYNNGRIPIVILNQELILPFITSNQTIVQFGTTVNLYSYLITIDEDSVEIKSLIGISEEDIPITQIQINGSTLIPDSQVVDITSIPASIVTQNSSHRFVTDSEKSKINSAIQGIKVNGTSITPDSNKIVDITVSNELSSTYQRSILENEDLVLEVGDTYEEAFGKLEKAIIDDEETVAAALNELNDKIKDVDTELDEESENPVQNKAITQAILDNEYVVSVALNNLNDRIQTKQDTLISGTNIKTINGTSILGSGNINVSGGSGTGGGGDENIIETIKVNGTALTPDANKAVDIVESVHVYPITSTELFEDLAVDAVITGVTSTDLDADITNGKLPILLFKVSPAANVAPEPEPAILGYYGANEYYFYNVLGNKIFYLTLKHTSQSTTLTVKECGAINIIKKLQINGIDKTVPGRGIVNLGTYIESVKINGTALTPDANNAVDITVPAAVTESTVSGWGFTKNAGTITGITMNGSSKGTSGVVNLGTVITSETSLSKGTTSGSGNAVTDVSVNGHTITLTKGSTFLTSETSLSKGTTSGSGNAVTDISVSGHTITLTKGSTFLTSHQNIKTINNNSLVGTGNVSIDTLPTVTSSDNGKILQVVNGAWALVTPTAIYSGTSTPNNSTGNDGDLYLQTS